MNKGQFISLLNNPAALNADSIAMLSDVVKEFPYFQTARLLYTKNLYDQNSMHYSGQLKMAAAYVADRKVLYSLINNPVRQQPAFVIEKRHEIVEEKIQKVVVNKSTENIIVEHKETLEALEEQPIDKKDVEIVELVLEAPEVKNNEPIVRVLELEKEYLNNAVDASIKIEVEEIDLKNEKSVDEKVKIDEDIVVAADSRFSFSDWLRLADPKIPKDEKQKINYTEIIDKFIVNEPKMTRQTASFYSPVDKARKSVVDNYEIVTETLAKIYVKQGNYPKAIKVYETLRLKYPGKSAYFAARISEIEKLIN